jgi:hypothetical protein
VTLLSNQCPSSIHWLSSLTSKRGVSLVREESQGIEEGHWLEGSVTSERGVSLVREESQGIEEGQWLERSVTGKRGESLGRRGTLVREERH